MARKAISEEDLLKEYYFQSIQLVEGKSPLACALIIGAMNENATMTLLSNFLAEGSTSESLLKESGTLGDFGRCINIAYALGLISKPVRSNLENISKIRNRFAHSRIALDFEDKDVAECCAAMTFPVVRDKPDCFSQMGQTNWLRFKTIAHYTFLWLLLCAAGTHREQRKTKEDWQWDPTKEPPV
jgi:DNA-binding MltR family transcriptional regulator